MRAVTGPGRLDRWLPLRALAGLGVCWWCGCADIAGFGPERTLPAGLLYFQDAEATSGAARCGEERPAFRSSSKLPMTADCDAADAPLAGRQSIAVKDNGWLGCDPCWEPAAELWVDLLFRAGGDPSFSALPFVPLRAEPVELDPVQREAGPFMVWARFTDGDDPVGTVGVRLFCAETSLASAVIPLPTGAARALRYHYRTDTGLGELWADEAAAGRAGPPQATLTCTGQAPVAGWLARGNVKPLPGGGTFWVDDVIVSRLPTIR
jgi:hypothetical protein